MNLYEVKISVRYRYANKEMASGEFTNNPMSYGTIIENVVAGSFNDAIVYVPTLVQDFINDNTFPRLGGYAAERILIGFDIQSISLKEAGIKVVSK